MLVLFSPSLSFCQALSFCDLLPRQYREGPAPELVIERIADFRSEDKTEPYYYARLTVTKGASQLRSASDSARTAASKNAPEH